MQLRLTPEDRKFLEELADRKIRPTKRQKAKALLGLASGVALEKVSMHVGVNKDELVSMVDQFKQQGLKGIGLEPSAGKRSGDSKRRRSATIEKTPGVCGGAARIAGTRIPVWQLVEARSLGVSEAQLLIDYPRLKAVNLGDAWGYAEDHPDEIAAQIKRNEVA
jgi:uncharacterized protein (DUF433 family)